MPDHKTDIHFVVGADRNLGEIVSYDDVMPILEGSVRAGLAGSRIVGPDGEPLWSAGSQCDGTGAAGRFPLIIEGEPVGTLEIFSDNPDGAGGISELLFSSINLIIRNNLKRLLTTEAHTAVVRESYDELLETNRRLVASETRYRELAESLELKVIERTRELERAHLTLLRQQKMASVGQLAAGIAHEINNPIGFISSNLNTLDRYIGRFKRLITEGRASLARTGGEDWEAFDRLWKELRTDYIMEDVDGLLGQSIEGAGRVSRIVSDLKGFSHVDDVGLVQVDINDELERTISVLEHERPHDAEVIREFSTLPPYQCIPAQLCQAFLAIILNAYQAGRDGLRLNIMTSCNNGSIVIQFRDNGPGMPPDISERIFEPFYTTRDVGKGMGMGLTLAYEIVTGMGGSIDVETGEDAGATFTINLPVTARTNV